MKIQLNRAISYSVISNSTLELACEQAPVGDSRVQSRANGMNRERSGESRRSDSHSLAREFFSDLAGSLLAG